MSKTLERIAIYAAFCLAACQILLFVVAITVLIIEAFNGA